MFSTCELNITECTRKRMLHVSLFELVHILSRKDKMFSYAYLECQRSSFYCFFFFLVLFVLGFFMLLG